MEKRVENIIPDRESAIKLIDNAIETLDPKPLEDIVEKLLTPEFRAAMGYMAVSGDKPDTITMFFVLCKHYGFLSEKESIDCGIRYVMSKRKHS